MGTQYQITGSVLAQQLSSTISNPSHPALPKYTHPHWKTKEEYEAVKEKKSHKTQEEEAEDWVGIRMCEGKIYIYIYGPSWGINQKKRFYMASTTPKAEKPAPDTR